MGTLVYNTKCIYEKGDEMKQAKVLIPIGILFTVSIILMIIFSNSGSGDIIINQAYCEEYPDMRVCTEDYVSEYEVVEDIFQALLVEGDGGIGERFCDNHFSGKVEQYCLNEDIEILPSDFYRLSSIIGVIPKGEGQYTVTTQYYDKTPGYEFHINLTIVDGIYLFSGLAYAMAPEPSDLALETPELSSYFEDIIDDYNANDRCREYFIEEAYYECLEDPMLFVPIETVPDNYTITEASTNTFWYEFDDTEEALSYRIIMAYKQVDGVLRVNDVTIITLDNS